MLLLHAVLATGHVSTWLTHLYTGNVQQTPEGQVVLNLPALADVVPDHAMVAVPCGHYGCVEVISYYRFADVALRDKGATFVRFSWSEWDDGISPVPVVDPRSARSRPLCVFLAHDVTKLTELGLEPTPISRAPARVNGRTFVSGPLQCVR